MDVIYVLLVVLFFWACLGLLSGLDQLRER